MYFYGIDENAQGAIEFVPLRQHSKTPWIIVGGCVDTEERAKLLLRQMMKRMERQNAQSL